jgi:hypothetical protein
MLSLMFIAILGLATIVFVMMGKHKEQLVEENMVAPIIV